MYRQLGKTIVLHHAFRIAHPYPYATRSSELRGRRRWLVRYELEYELMMRWNDAVNNFIRCFNQGAPAERTTVV